MRRLPPSKFKECISGCLEFVEDEDLQGVAASLHQGVGSMSWWNVSVSPMEFCRTEPLEQDLSDAITGALSAVPGVATAQHEDREIWVVQGSPTGPALVTAAAAIVDGFLPQIEKELDDL